MGLRERWVTPIPKNRRWKCPLQMKVPNQNKTRDWFLGLRKSHGGGDEIRPFFQWEWVISRQKWTPPRNFPTAPGNCAWQRRIVKYSLGRVTPRHRHRTKMYLLRNFEPGRRWGSAPLHGRKLYPRVTFRGFEGARASGWRCSVSVVNYPRRRPLFGWFSSYGGYFVVSFPCWVSLVVTSTKFGLICSGPGL